MNHPSFYSQVARGFDRAAYDYDALYRNNAIMAWLRTENLTVLQDSFPPASRLLEIGCGTGEEALALNQVGYSIVATDVSAEMIRIAQEKGHAQGSEVVWRTLPAGQLDTLLGEFGEAGFEGAYASFGGLNCEPSLENVVENLSRLLCPEAPLVCSIINRWCLWEIGWHLLHLKPRQALRRLNRNWVEAGLSSHDKSLCVPMKYYTPGQFARCFSKHFRVKRIIGLPVVLPPPYLAHLFNVKGSWFARLDSIERGIRNRAPFRAWGDHFLIVFERNASRSNHVTMGQAVQPEKRNHPYHRNGRQVNSVSPDETAGGAFTYRHGLSEVYGILGCPYCSNALGTGRMTGVYCPRCERKFETKDRFPVLLRHEDISQITALNEVYRTDRLAEGWKPVSSHQALALPYGHLAGYSPLYWPVRAESFRALMDLLRQEGPAPGDGPVADMGAGIGWLSHRLAQLGYFVFAVEANPDSEFGLGASEIYLSQEEPEFVPVQASLEYPPFQAESLRLMIFNASLHYAADLGETLRRSRQILRPGGRLVILDTPIAVSPRPGNRHGSRQLGRQELQSSLIETGFRVRWVSVHRGKRWQIHQIRSWLKGSGLFSFPIVIAERVQ